MRVHCACAVKEGTELFRADGNRKWQAERRPHRVAAADPVPEGKDAGRVDSELGRRGWVGRNRSHAPGRIVAKRAPQPGKGGAGVCHCFLGRKRFGGDSDQRVAGVEGFRCVAEIGAVDIGDEMNTGPVVPRCECAGRHLRSQRRAADANGNDIGNFSVGPDLIGEGEKAVERRGYIRHDVRAID